MKHLDRFELDAHTPDAPLYHAPGAFLAGTVAGIGAAILWALWWPLGVLAVILAYCVCLCATQVKRSTQHYAAHDAEANLNHGRGLPLPQLDARTVTLPTWNGPRHNARTDVF